MTKNNTMMVRVDKDIWQFCRSKSPKSSDPELSRILYNSSLFKLEENLGGLFEGKKRKNRK